MTNSHSINAGTETQSYSNVTGVLAGFSLTALILILSDKDVLLNENPEKEKINQILIMFFISFTGFVASSFAFAVQSRNTKNNRLQNTKNFILGYSTAIPVILLFSGLSSLIGIIVKSGIDSVYSTFIFFFAVLMIPAFTVNTAPAKSWNPIKLPHNNAHRILYGLTYLPIIVALSVRACLWDTEPWPWLFYYTTAVLFCLMVAGNMIEIFIEAKYEDTNDNYQLPYIGAAIWIIIHSVFFGLLLFK